VVFIVLSCVYSAYYLHFSTDKTGKREQNASDIGSVQDWLSSLLLSETTIEMK
jgi:hypothetical protein